jgi:hypothetical protein
MRATRHKIPSLFPQLLSTRRGLLLIATLGMMHPDVTAAQGLVARDCDIALVSQTDPAAVLPGQRERHPNVAYPAMAGRIAADEWLALADSLVADLEDDTVMPAAAKQAFASNLLRLRDEIAFVQRQPDPEVLRRTGRIIRQQRFRIEPSRARAEAFYLFRGTPDSVVIDGAMDLLARRALCWRAMVISRMLTAYGETAREEAVRALRDAARRWDNYGEKGYSQFPWELALNSARFRRTSTEPPANQVIFLHPALGLELVVPDGGTLEDLQRVNTVTVEPLGYILYTRSRANYFGVSTLVSLPSESRIGAGVLAHIGRYGKIGYVIWRSRGGAIPDDRRVIASADLYQFLTSTPQAIRDAKARALTLLRREALRRVGVP